jgi:hypothetical protein
MRREKEERGLSSIYLLRSSLIQKEIHASMVSVLGADKTKGKINIGY